MNIRKMTSRITEIYEGKIGDIVFYLLFAYIYFYRFYWTTMFHTMVRDERIFKYPAYAAYAGIAVFVMVRIGISLISETKKGIFYAAVMVIAVLSSINSGEKEIAVIVLLLLAAVGREIKPVFICSLVIGFALTVAAYFASVNGYIPYLLYSGSENMLTHAFGLVYRTDLAAHVLFFIMLYGIIRAEKLRLWEFMIMVSAAYFTWRYTEGKAGALCCVIFLAGLAVLEIFYFLKKRWPVIPKWTAVIHIVLCALIFLMVFLIHTDGLDNLSSAGAGTFSSRIYHSKSAFKEYPVNFFGHVIEERGWGGIVDASKPYFFLDITYVRILLKYGSFVFLLYLFTMTRASIKAIENKQIILALALAVTALECVSEHHGIDIAYNVLILAGAGKYSGTLEKKNCTEDAEKMKIVDTINEDISNS